MPAFSPAFDTRTPKAWNPRVWGDDALFGNEYGDQGTREPREDTRADDVFRALAAADAARSGARAAATDDARSSPDRDVDPYRAVASLASDTDIANPWDEAQNSLDWLDELRRQEAEAEAERRADIEDQLRALLEGWTVTDAEHNVDLLQQRSGFENDLDAEKVRREAARLAEERALEDSIDAELRAAEAAPEWRGRSNDGTGPAERVKRFTETQGQRVRNARRRMSDEWSQWSTGWGNRGREFQQQQALTIARRASERARQRAEAEARAREDVRQRNSYFVPSPTERPTRIDASGWDPAEAARRAAIFGWSR